MEEVTAGIRLNYKVAEFALLYHVTVLYLNVFYPDFLFDHYTCTSHSLPKEADFALLLFKRLIPCPRL